MEETDVCHSIPALRALQQAIPNCCTAKTLRASERCSLGVQALARHHSISSLAQEAGVSRKFVHRQAGIAQAALDDAFTPQAAKDEVLFHLPVTKAWLEQVALGLILINHSSYRGVVEFCRDLLDVKMSVGTVHNIARQALAQARAHNLGHALDKVTIAGLDEIFQNGQPVLVGADIASTYCFLLSREDQRDADTWAIRLWELQPRGFHPQATVADFGLAIRAGQKRAFPDVPCRGDVFHALHAIGPVLGYLDNRAYDAIAALQRLQCRYAKLQSQARAQQSGQRGALRRQINRATQQQEQAIALADHVALLVRWLHYDVFAVSALSYAERRTLFDFILAELQTRAPLCSHRLDPVCTLLQNHRDELLAFAVQLDHDLDALATQWQIPLAVVRELFNLQALDPRQPARWQKETALRQRLGHRFHPLGQAVQKLAAGVVRASSVIENINSRLRNYFFLRRHLGNDYLALLQFFLNHRRFLRSEHPERKHKSPAELLTGQHHPHWLEMLGHRRFSQN
jgi:hypothetical protein